MTRLTVTAFGAIIVVSAVVRADAQSLADVARAERARRQAITKHGKLYTNESLPPEPGAAASVPLPMGPGSPSSVPAERQDRKDATAKDESFWRQRIESVRAALARARILADALQSRINALTNDIAARDDPAQRALLTTARQDAVMELERMKQDILAHEKTMAVIQEEARRAGVPAGWVR